MSLNTQHSRFFLHTKEQSSTLINRESGEVSVRVASYLDYLLNLCETRVYTARI